MGNERVEYTFLWFIENYSYCWHKNGEFLSSPIFTANRLDGTCWRLFLYPRGYRHEDKGCISIYLGRSRTVVEPEKFAVEYELSIVATKGKSRIFIDKHEFNLSQMSGGSKFLLLDEIRLRRKEDFLPNDTLTVCCKLWNGEGYVNKVPPISARTRILIEDISFLQLENELWLFQLNQKKNFKIQSHSKKGCIISSDLYCSDEKIIVETIPSDKSYILCKQKFFLRDVSGNLIVCGEDDNRLDEERRDIQKLTLTLSKPDIVAKKNEYLPDGRLNLLCEFTFATGLKFVKKEETVKETSLMDLDIPFSSPEPVQPIQRSVYKNTESPVKKLTLFPGALEDIKDLYIEKCFSDVELKTETNSFSAHKFILAARSPVFKAILTSDMKEKYNNRIQIDDLADDIVQQLLLFLYSGSVGNLQWTSSTQLYYAADKYQIGKLKELCSSFLLENLTTSNVSELLVLSYRHNDAELKKSVEDFILQHEDQVFGSKEWEKLIETDPQLVIKTMHLKYKRKSVQN